MNIKYDVLFVCMWCVIIVPYCVYTILCCSCSIKKLIKLCIAYIIKYISKFGSKNVIIYSPHVMMLLSVCCLQIECTDSNKLVTGWQPIAPTYYTFRYRTHGLYPITCYSRIAIVSKLRSINELSTVTTIYRYSLCIGLVSSIETCPRGILGLQGSLVLRSLNRSLRIYTWFRISQLDWVFIQSDGKSNRLVDNVFVSPDKLNTLCANGYIIYYIHYLIDLGRGNVVALVGLAMDVYIVLYKKKSKISEQFKKKYFLVAHVLLVYGRDYEVAYRGASSIMFCNS